MTDQIPLLDVDPAARREFDYYPTPGWMTRALLTRVPWINDVFEPCSGFDAIANVFRERGRKVVTNDVNPETPAQLHMDACDPDAWVQLRSTRLLWCVTNPPFNLADRIVPLAVEHYANVAMMLRLSWLEPTEARALFLALHPPTRLIVMPRHDWRGTGSTDSVTSAWFIWSRGALACGVDVVMKAERDELIARYGKDELCRT